MKNLNRRPGGGGDIFAYKRETGERKERVKRSNSLGGGGDLSAKQTKQKNRKLRVRPTKKESRVAKLTT